MDQELFNSMMREAVKCLQEEGLLPVKEKEEEADKDEFSKETKILQDAGLLPRK